MQAMAEMSTAATATPSEPGGAHHHHHGHSSQRALGAALALTATFMGVEFAVGWWSGSLALLADAGHMVGDAGALALALISARIASRPRDSTKTYGYRRAEVLGAFANALVLLLLAGWIVVEAAGRLAAPPDIKGIGMVVTAALGLLINGVSAWILAARGGHGINVRAAFLHVIGDALGSVAALVAGTLLLTLGWRAADPIASLTISLLLVVGAVRLLREASHVLMEGAPPGVDVAQLQKTILETSGVRSVHDLHVWLLTSTEPMLTAHVVLDRRAHGTEVAFRVGERLRRAHGITHVTIQPEAAPAGLVELRKGHDDPPSRNKHSSWPVGT